MDKWLALMLKTVPMEFHPLFKNEALSSQLDGYPDEAAEFIEQLNSCIDLYKKNITTKPLHFGDGEVGGK